LQSLIIYIHLNPVKHKFKKDFKEYLYSSYRYIASGHESFANLNLIPKIFVDLDNFIYCHEEGRMKYDNVMEEINRLDEKE
jgi:putative transposase